MFVDPRKSLRSSRRIIWGRAVVAWPVCGDGTVAARGGRGEGIAARGMRGDGSEITLMIEQCNAQNGKT